MAIAGAGWGDPSWRPIAVVSIAASALFIVFLFLPWGNATFLLRNRHPVWLDRSNCRTPSDASPEKRLVLGCDRRISQNA
jgi:hypothetical protein